MLHPIDTTIASLTSVNITRQKQTAEDYRLQRYAQHLHALGPRACAEFITELSLRIGCRSAALALLDEYERLTPAMVSTVGADRFPPRLSLVPQ